jgi:hypothetical protein
MCASWRSQLSASDGQHRQYIVQRLIATQGADAKLTDLPRRWVIGN